MHKLRGIKSHSFISVTREMDDPSGFENDHSGDQETIKTMINRRYPKERKKKREKKKKNLK